MTAYKTILMPWPDPDMGPTPLDVACALGKDFGSHVMALHVRPDLRAVAPLSVEEIMSMADNAALERAVAARKAFENDAREHGVAAVAEPKAGTAEPTAGEGISAEWIELSGREEEAVAWYGRFADLVVMVRALKDHHPIPADPTLHAALLETGRPLLLAPPQVGRFGQRIAIAWDGSVEAGRAVTAALPLLTKAESVVVLVADEGQGHPRGSDDLLHYLGWEGVTAEVKELDARIFDTGDTLLAEVERRGADMLIMGAYSHSRWREMILGGVTKYIVHHAKVPVLLCH